MQQDPRPHSLESTRTINRRRHFRREDHCAVQIQTVDVQTTDSDACSRYCLSRDISASGIRLHADRCYTAGSKVLLTLESTENGWTQITSRLGSVVWTKLDASGARCELGVHFIDDDGEIAVL